MINKNSSHSKIKKEKEGLKSDKIFSGDPSKTETILPRINNRNEDKLPVKFLTKNFTNHNEYSSSLNPHRRSKTLLKRSKPKKAKLAEPEKPEEKFNFMDKFNQEVRERNRLRSIKVRRPRTRARRHRKHKNQSIIYYSFCI